jgi:hypothetical protein
VSFRSRRGAKVKVTYMKIHSSTPAYARRLISGAVTAGALTFCLVTDARAQNWSLTVGAGGSYDSNVPLSGPAPNGNISSNVAVGLGRNVTFRGGGLNFAANASQFFYRDYTPLNNLNYSLIGGASVALTRRLSWSVSDSLNSSYSRDSKILTDAGLFLPTVVTRSNAASTQLTYALTKRTQATWAVAEQNVVFSSSELTGGTSLSTSSAIARQMSRSQTLGISYSFQRTFSSGTQGSIQALLGTWQSTAGKSLTLNASAGVQPHTQPGRKGYLFSPAFSAGLGTRLSKTRSFSLNYGRTLEQSLGLTEGVHLVQSVAANLTQTLGRHLSVAAGGSYSRGSDDLLPNIRTTGHVADVSLRYSATPKLSIVIDSSAYVYTVTPNPAVSSYRTTMSLAYGTTWR